MALIIISYDVDGEHNVEMKECLLKKGYEDIIVSINKVVCNLPNTTLVKAGVQSNNGLEDMKMCAFKVGADLERAISIDVNNWEAIKGDSHLK